MTDRANDHYLWEGVLSSLDTGALMSGTVLLSRGAFGPLLAEVVVREAEVVGQLVAEGGADLGGELLLGAAAPLDVALVHEDARGQVAARSRAEHLVARQPYVEAEEGLGAAPGPRFAPAGRAGCRTKEQPR